jgi:hypothetical protein
MRIAKGMLSLWTNVHSLMSTLQHSSRRIERASSRAPLSLSRPLLTAAERGRAEEGVRSKSVLCWEESTHDGGRHYHMRLKMSMIGCCLV